MTPAITIDLNAVLPSHQQTVSTFAQVIKSEAWHYLQMGTLACIEVYGAELTELIQLTAELVLYSRDESIVLDKYKKYLSSEKEEKITAQLVELEQRAETDPDSFIPAVIEFDFSQEIGDLKHFNYAFRLIIETYYLQFRNLTGAIVIEENWKSYANTYVDIHNKLGGEITGWILEYVLQFVGDFLPQKSEAFMKAHPPSRIQRQLFDAGFDAEVYFAWE